MCICRSSIQLWSKEQGTHLLKMTKYISLFFIFTLFLVQAEINILHIEEKGPPSSLTVFGSAAINVHTVSGSSSDLQQFRHDICSRLLDLQASNRSIHVIFFSPSSNETASNFIKLLLIHSQQFVIQFSPQPPTVIKEIQNVAQSYSGCNTFPISLEPNYDLYEFVWPIQIVQNVIEPIANALDMTQSILLYDSEYILRRNFKFHMKSSPLRRTDFGEKIERLWTTDAVYNFFIIASMDTIKWIIDNVRAVHTSRNFLWIFITADDVENLSICPYNSELLFVRPIFPNVTRNVDELFNDVALQTISGIRESIDKGHWPHDRFGSNAGHFNMLLKYISNNVQTPLGQVNSRFRSVTMNHELFVKFHMSISAIVCGGHNVITEMEVAQYSPENNQLHHVRRHRMDGLKRKRKLYRVAACVQIPFVFHDPNAASGFSGYSIDLLDHIADEMSFDYVIDEVADRSFGNLRPDGSWTGIVRELHEKRADIGLGSMSILAERKRVIDFTVSFYDMVGIGMMSHIPRAPDDALRFLRVIDTDVWIGILIAYLATSLLIWLVDRTSPFSCQNTATASTPEFERRIFHLRESLWFCVISMTPQGGGVAPKSPSGRIIAATWWLFGFIIISSYTANLAAFLTLHSWDSIGNIESIEDLSEQNRYQYAPMPGSFAMLHFQRMATIEARFYGMWTDMAMSDSLTPLERKPYTVWEYPLPDLYTRLWATIQRSDAPATLDEAALRVQRSNGSSGFVFLGDETDIQYLTLKYCNLRMIGKASAQRPYAIALQQGSPLKNDFDKIILTLLSTGWLDELKNKWWKSVNRTGECRQMQNEFDGISVKNIGAFFWTILMGILLSSIVLVCEYLWFRGKRNRNWV